MPGNKKTKIALVREYINGRIYIVDDKDPNAIDEMDLENSQLAKHYAKCNLVRNFFLNYTNYEVKSVHFPKSASEKEYFDYWRREIATWQKPELTMIYFHGSAGNADIEYAWKFNGGPNGWLNAHSLIEMVNGGEADAMFMLDCCIPDRWVNKPVRNKQGSTEIMSRGECLTNPDGVPLDHEGEFTESMVHCLEYFVTHIHDEFKNWKCLQSIPELKTRNKAIVFNPRRVWFNKTKYNDTEVINRMKIDPNRVREIGKITFVCERIQGPGELRWPEHVERRIAAEVAKHKLEGFIEIDRRNMLRNLHDDREDPEDEGVVLKEHDAQESQGVDVKQDVGYEDSGDELFVSEDRRKSASPVETVEPDGRVVIDLTN